MDGGRVFSGEAAGDCQRQATSAGRTENVIGFWIQLVGNALNALHADRAPMKGADLERVPRLLRFFMKGFDDFLCNRGVQSKSTHAFDLRTISEHLLELCEGCRFDDGDAAANFRSSAVGGKGSTSVSA